MILPGGEAITAESLWVIGGVIGDPLPPYALASLSGEPSWFALGGWFAWLAGVVGGVVGAGVVAVPVVFVVSVLVVVTMVVAVVSAVVVSALVVVA